MVARSGEGRMKFQGGETILCDTIMVRGQRSSRIVENNLINVIFDFCMNVSCENTGLTVILGFY